MSWILSLGFIKSWLLQSSGGCESPSHQQLFHILLFLSIKLTLIIEFTKFDAQNVGNPIIKCPDFKIF